MVASIIELMRQVPKGTRLEVILKEGAEWSDSNSGSCGYAPSARMTNKPGKTLLGYLKSISVEDATVYAKKCIFISPSILPDPEHQDHPQRYYDPFYIEETCISKVRVLLSLSSSP
ncbi:hypothetical protein HY501_03465 [Candidatus Woesearchaeota archaeon]|nr:hypothetical protein [Candidatus Woesearchaeota archaeon]